MAITENLDVEIRETRGKQAAKALRAAGRVPAVIYSDGKPGTSVSVDAKAFRRIRRKHGISSLVHLQGLEGGEVLAIYKQVQLHPVTHEARHIDFHRCEAGTPVHIKVDIRLKGLPVGVDKRGGTLVQTRKWIEVSCLPKDIPDFILLDVSNLDVGDALHVGEAGISTEKFTFITDPKTTIATVTASRDTLKAMKDEAKEGEEGAEVAEGEGEGAEAKPEGDAKA